METLALAARELKWSEATPADRVRNDLNTARAHFLGEDYTRARQHADGVIETLQDQLLLIRVEAQAPLGQIALAVGDVNAARSNYVDAIHLLTGIGVDRDAAQLWFELANLLDDVDLEREAADAYRRAATSTGLGVRSGLLRVKRPTSTDRPAGGQAAADA